MTAAVCERCGLSLPTGRRGRRAKYCSTECRQAAWRERAGAATEAPGTGPDMAAVVGGALTVAVSASDAAAAVDGLLAWLAETMDGLAPAARAVYGPKLAQTLLAALEIRDRIVRGRGDPLAALRDRAATRELRSATAAVLDAFDVQPVTLP
jgi:hypothetical protein